MGRIGLKSLKTPPLERQGSDASLWGSASDFQGKSPKPLRVVKAPPQAPALDYGAALVRDLERLRALPSERRAEAWDRLLPRWSAAGGVALGCTIIPARFSLAFKRRVYNVETTDLQRATVLHMLYLYARAQGARQRADVELWMLYRCADLIGRKRESFPALARRFSRTATRVREAVRRVDARLG